MQTDTLVLRFRDLVTADNETITRHNEIISKYGYVWWGWWKKGNEKTPLEKFATLSAKAKENQITVYLVDSGQNLVYEAVCSKIEFRENSKFISPDKTRTPKYYRDQEYFAWFQFTSIKQCNSEKLNEFSYVHCSDLFIDKNTDYSIFNNKKIFSVRELIQQNRTVWFVRKAYETDLDNEIVLLNSTLVQPTHFSEKYYQTSGNSIIWLSDLHLSDGAFEYEKGKQHSTLAQHLKTCVSDKNVGGLLISGDITSCAKKDGFQKGKILLQDIGRDVILNSENILICPGNHDFSRESKNLPEETKPSFIYENTNNFQDYSEFYRSIYNLAPNQYFAAGKKLLLSSGHLIEIVALNSVLLQQYPNFEGHGYLSQEQLDFVADKIGWNNTENENSIRLVMMHHHYLPTCYTEIVDANKASSAVYDADRLMNWLTKYNVKVLLHGHKHRSFVSQICYPVDQSKDITNEGLKRITVIGMGGTGAAGVENKFATLQFDNDMLTVEFYRLYGDESSKDAICQKINISL